MSKKGLKWRGRSCLVGRAMMQGRDWQLPGGKLAPEEVWNYISELATALGNSSKDKCMIVMRKGCTSVLSPSLVMRVQLVTSLEIACRWRCESIFIQIFSTTDFLPWSLIIVREIKLSLSITHANTSSYKKYIKTWIAATTKSNLLASQHSWEKGRQKATLNS